VRPEPGHSPRFSRPPAVHIWSVPAPALRRYAPTYGGNSEQRRNARTSRLLSRAGKPVSRELAEIGRRGQPIDVMGGGDVDPDTGRLLSIAQLQAALRAHMMATGGEPTDPVLPASAAASLVAGRAEATPWIQDALLLPGGPPGWPAADLADHAPSGWVAVLAAHPEAGCSTTALALADAAALTGVPVHLLQAGHPGHRAGGGLAAVTHDELGAIAGGWRRGRRGLVTLDRPVMSETRAWPPPPPLPLTATPLITVVDGGAADIAAGGEFPGPLASWWLPQAKSPAAVVLVCRASTSGINATEHLLRALDDHLTTARLDPVGVGTPRVLVAAVGGSRWRAPVRAAGGPHLERLRKQRHLLGVPHVRQLELVGPSADPLPRSVLAAGRALWTLAGSVEHYGAQR
jgi:hypothetical protein